MNLETTTAISSSLSHLHSPPRAGGRGGGANAAARVLVDLTRHEGDEEDEGKIAKIEAAGGGTRGRTERSRRPPTMGATTTVSPMSDSETVLPRGEGEGGVSDDGCSRSLSSPVLVPPLGGGRDTSAAAQRGAAKQLRRLRDLQDRRLCGGMMHGRKRERHAGTGPTSTSPARVDADGSGAGAGTGTGTGTAMSRRVSAPPTTLDSVKRQLTLIERKAREYAQRELECLNKAKQLRDRREQWTHKYDKYAKLVATKDPQFAPAQLPPIMRG